MSYVIGIPCPRSEDSVCRVARRMTQTQSQANGVCWFRGGGGTARKKKERNEDTRKDMHS